MTYHALGFDRRKEAHPGLLRLGQRASESLRSLSMLAADRAGAREGGDPL
jgi:hypothetical protein